MKLLLDTHIWLWSLLEPARLSRKVTTALNDTAIERWLSPLSIWEALLLIERGRLSVDKSPAEWVREALERAPVTEAPLTNEVAIVSRTFRSPHRDPVDRFLAGTAQVFGLTLVTADRGLAAFAGISVLRNQIPKQRRRGGASAGPGT